VGVKEDKAEGLLPAIAVNEQDSRRRRRKVYSELTQ